MRSSDFKNKLSFPVLTLSLLCFAVANIISYMKMDWNHVFATDFAIQCGFPFSFYYFGGWGIGYIWSGMIADVTVAVLTSFILGVIWPLIKQRKPNIA